MWKALVRWSTGGHAVFPCHTGRDAERFRTMSNLDMQHRSVCTIVFDPGPESISPEFARG